MPPQQHTATQTVYKAHIGVGVDSAENMDTLASIGAMIGLCIDDRVSCSRSRVLLICNSLGRDCA